MIRLKDLASAIFRLIPNTLIIQIAISRYLLVELKVVVIKVDSQNGKNGNSKISI